MNSHLNQLPSGTVPRVVMLVFDQFPRSGSTKLAEHSEPVGEFAGESMWNRLDLESVYFEQFCWQHAGRQFPPADWVEDWSRVGPVWIHEGSASATISTLTEHRIAAATSTDDAGDVARGNAADSIADKAGMGKRSGCLILCVRQPDAESGAKTTERPEDIRATGGVQWLVIAALWEWLAQFDSDSTPVCLVTAAESQRPVVEDAVEDMDTMAGTEDSAELMLSTLHVPLWIRWPDCTMGRVQALCGSQDLLPTLADLLRFSTDELSDRCEAVLTAMTRTVHSPITQDEPRSDHVPASESTAAADVRHVDDAHGTSPNQATHDHAGHDRTDDEVGGVTVSSDVQSPAEAAEAVAGMGRVSSISFGERSVVVGAVSLVLWCFCPGLRMARCLRIHSGQTEMLRTDDFLAVRSERPEADTQRSSQTAAAAAARERLYVKPEDVWQLNDQAGVYQTVLEEMQPLWQSPVW